MRPATVLSLFVLLVPSLWGQGSLSPIVPAEIEGEIVFEDVQLISMDEEYCGGATFLAKAVEWGGADYWTHYGIRYRHLLHGQVIEYLLDRYYLTRENGFPVQVSVVDRLPWTDMPEVQNFSWEGVGFRAETSMRRPGWRDWIPHEGPLLNGVAYERWLNGLGEARAGTEQSVQWLAVVGEPEVVEQTATVWSEEDIKIHLGSYRARRVVLRIGDDLKETAWLDPDGNGPYRSDIGSSRWEWSYREDNAKHLARSELRDSTEHFGYGVGRKAIHEEDLDAIQLRVHYRGDPVDLEKLGESEDVQVVERLEDGAVLEIRRRRLNADPERGRAKGVPREVADALRPDWDIQSIAPAIRRQARDIVEDRTDPVAMVAVLARWVREHIQDSDETGWHTALATLKSGRGDATERALLLAALCRASGIPARYVAGYRFSDSALWGSAWAEVWVDGAWHPAHPDAAGMPRPLLLPTWRANHTPGAARDLVLFPRSFRADLIGAGIGSRWLDFDAPENQPRVVGRNFLAPAQGVEIRLPEGWGAAEAEVGDTTHLGRIEPPWDGEGIHVTTQPMHWSSAFGRSRGARSERFEHPGVRSAWLERPPLEGGRDPDAGGWIVIYRTGEALILALPPGESRPLEDYRPLLDGLVFRGCVLCNDN